MQQIDFKSAKTTVLSKFFAEKFVRKQGAGNCRKLVRTFDLQSAEVGPTASSNKIRLGAEVAETEADFGPLRSAHR